ncbi:MAG: mechanosensitive ion channel family protein [Halanaerobiaceae bacterium]
MDIEKILAENVVPYLGKIALAFLVLIIGRFLIRRILYKLERKIQKNLDPSLKTFINSLVRVTLYILLLVITASTLGIEMTSFVAILGAAGLAIGLALQGSLANFAGGVLILVFRPFDVGDFIETGSHKGKVEEIQILYTTLITRDNKNVIIPNGKLANDSIINYTKTDTRRVELSIGVSYEDDIREVKKQLQDIVAAHELILEEPEPLIRVAEHAASSINFNVYVWAKNDDFWNIYYDLLEEIKIVFDEQDITFPFPQMDVHMDQ